MTNDLRRLAVAGMIALSGLASTSCQTAKDPFPDTGALLVVLRDSSLGVQTTSEATRQITNWRAERIEVTVPDRPDYRFTPNGTCSLFATPGRDGDPSVWCGGSGLTLEATGGAREVTFRIDLDGMESFNGRRPSLPAGQDFDGDGVLNETDNCKLVPNPGQETFDPTASGLPGLVCAADDGEGNPTLPDQDNDGVRDSLDDCPWFPNPILPGDTSQTDVNSNGIGDLCEVASPIPLGSSGRLSLECPGEFTLATGTASVFVVDFTGALTCDNVAGVCSLDPARITIRKSSEDASVAKPCVDVTAAPVR